MIQYLCSETSCIFDVTPLRLSLYAVNLVLPGPQDLNMTKTRKIILNTVIDTGKYFRLNIYI
jgi:hypothetical protein